MEKRIIEINGVKIEVDLRQATTVESYKIGDNVKVLKKKYESWTDYPGIIVGFDNFTTRPTIVIAYLDLNYTEAKIEFVYFNQDSKDLELCPMIDDQIAVDRGNITARLEKEISKKQAELDDLTAKKEYFLKNFGAYFGEVK